MMSAPGSSSKPLFKGPETSNPSTAGCAAGLRQVVWFTAAIAFLSLILSLPVLPFTDLPWWRVFRRCASIAAVLVLWWMVARRSSEHPWQNLGLAPWRAGKRPLLQGAALGFGLVLLLGLAYLACDVWEISVTQDRWRLWRTVIGFLPAALLVAVLEELIFRGYLLQRLMACSKALAVLGTSAGYALVHLKPAWTWPDSAMELTGLFILGVVLALSVLRTGHLYLAIGLHASLAYWARLNKLLVEFPTDSSWQWLVGTNRLVNGLVPWGLLVLIGVALIRWNRRTISV